MSPGSERQRRSTGLLLLLGALHSAVLLFAGHHFARFLAPLLPLWFLLLAGVFTAGCALVSALSRLRLLPATLLFAAVLAGIRGLLSLLGLLRSALGAEVRADAAALFVDTSAVAAAPVIAILWLSVFLLTRRPAGYALHPALAAPLLVAVFWTQGRYNLTLYDYPFSYAVVVGIFVLLEILILVAAFRGGVAQRIGEHSRSLRRQLLRGAGGFLLVLIPLVLLVGSLLYTRYNEGATARGGGLLESSLFRFDFSDYLRLESEISLSDDLVLFLKKPPRGERSYLRRYVLAGYGPRRGFYRREDAELPETVGNSPRRFPDPGYQSREGLEQEVYLVNFDPSSLLALNYPVEVLPYRTWPDASFSRVYRVTSRVSTARSWELRAAGSPASPGSGAGAELPDFYTTAGENEAIAALAEEVTEGTDNPYEQVAAIETHLREEYFYSLSPGVAPDGDQLNHFLFDSRKGYCSYFAFAMALMVRSLDIPARVAVGFYVDPQLQVLDYHVVRADMAHAWVEVFFPEYGWVEFDPTSSTVAPGEDVEFGTDVQVDEIAGLLQEILENRNSLAPLEAQEMEQSAGEEEPSPLETLARTARRWWWAFLLSGYLLLLAGRHALLAGVALSGSSRRAVIRGYRRLQRSAAYLGWPQRRDESVLEHAQRVSAGAGVPFRQAAERYLAALFAADETLLPPAERDDGLPGTPRRQIRRGLLRRAGYLRRLRFLVFPFGRPVAEGGRVGGAGAGRGRRGRAVHTALVLVLSLVFMQMGGAWASAQESQSGEADAETVSPDEEGATERRGWDAQDYVQAIDRAIRGERYERALSLVEEGKGRFPRHAPLYLVAGDLYRDEELYEMALGEYRLAEEIEPQSYQALHGQSLALGRLNREREAIRVLERLRGLYPDTVEVISDLGWLYFKTHQLSKGEELLRSALDRLGMNRSLAMTLATIYADMYEYDQAKRYYETAIGDAREAGRSYFASVAQYNLSLLEKTFYNFDAALAATEESLRLARRPPGLLARGELHERRLGFSRALSDYNAAYALDEETPLAQLSLASLHQRFGRLDEALAYALDVYESEDGAWMFNFGTDLQRHGLDMHALLADIYEGLYHQAAFETTSGLFDRFGRLFRRIGYRVKAWFHRRNERIYARQVAEAYAEEGSTLNAAWTYFRAYEDYPGKAMDYLTRAREFETAIIPESASFYRMEGAVLDGDPEDLRRARRAFDPVWERVEAAEAAREEALLLARQGGGRADSGAGASAFGRVMADLYLLNPGGIRQYGLHLPLRLEAALPGFDEAAYSGLVRELRRAGLAPADREETPLRLVISAESGDDQAVSAVVYRGETLLRSGRYRLEGTARRDLRALAARIAAGVFRVE